MRQFIFRLRPAQDLKKELQKFVKENDIRAGFIVTCVGSLKRATLRFAEEDIQTFEECFEIVSLVGTLSQDGVHLHISLSDKNGKVIGGHLKEKCLIHTTAEIVVGESSRYVFHRKFDNQTGFKELEVAKDK
jgi:predicted DNA-binding protein with PD1-like motif